MVGSLLTTKLSIPLPRAQSIQRSRLEDRLKLDGQRPLTLLVAPPGFGKSTLAAQWALALPEGTVTWLTLDDEDNEPSRFLRYWIASLNIVEPTLGVHAQQLLETLQSASPRMVIASLINDITAWQRPIHLVIDDYHTIKEASIHDAMIYLLEHMPANLYLLITTRVDPPLPLSRLRARGQLTEVRAADLRFKLEETVAFFDTMGVSLQLEDISKLEDQTEGWAAGLQIAALSLIDRDEDSRRRFVTSFTGSHRHILDYLADEVLSRQPEHIQSFLFQTAILNRLSASLCNAVTGNNDGEELLSYLDQANLFLIALDDERQWYRYHHLFADVLRHRLQRRYPELPVVLYARASQWYEEHGLYGEALVHAVAAGNIARAADLIVLGARGPWTRQLMTDIRSWLKLLPAGTLLTYPRLVLLDAQILLFNGQIKAVEKRVQEAVRLLSSETDPLLQSELVILRSVFANLAGSSNQALSLVKQALEELPEDHPLRIIAWLSTGLAHYLRGELDLAEDLLRKVQTFSLSLRNIYHAQLSMAYLAQIQLLRGKRREAEAIYDQLVAVAPEHPTALLVGRGALRYERDDLNAAVLDVNQAIQLAEPAENALALVGGRLYLAFLAHARHETAHAQKALSEALDVADKASIQWLWCIPSLGARWTQLALLQGDLDSARRWAGKVDTAAGEMERPLQREAEQIALARIRIADQRSEQALPILDAVLAEAQRGDRQLHVMQALGLRALALRQSEQAFSSLERALSLAAPEDFIRLFVDEGEAMRQLLERFVNNRTTSPLRSYAAQLLRAFAGVTPAHIAAAQGLTEPLSDRELEVLGLMATGLSNADIANRLYLSVATVKKHGTNIFGKLSVTNRQEAVARAQELRLIG